MKRHAENADSFTLQQNTKVATYSHLPMEASIFSWMEAGVKTTSTKHWEGATGGREELVSGRKHLRNPTGARGATEILTQSFSLRD